MSGAKNGGQFLTLSSAVQDNIIKYLPLGAIKNCRLVCKEWNPIFLSHLKLQIDLCDGLLQFFMMGGGGDGESDDDDDDPPLKNKLPVTHIILHDLTSLTMAKAHKLPGSGIISFRIQNFKNVAKLTFFEGCSLEWKERLLRTFRWVQELYFSPHSFPVFPSQVHFENLEKLELNSVKPSEDGELIDFFQTAYFPILKQLKLGFCCRQDFRTYANAHFFIGRHFSTLKKLRLSIEFGTTVGGGRKSTDSFNLSLFESDAESILKELELALENRKEYREFLENISRMHLEVISVGFSPHEGRAPWGFTLKLLQSQRNLHKLKFLDCVQDFNQVFQTLVIQNSETIEKISIPVRMSIDCSVLHGHCPGLRSFSIGDNFNFIHPSLMPPSELQGRLTNLQDFPVSNLLTTLCIGIPLSKPDILWLSKQVPASKFMVRGFPAQWFSKEDVAVILNERRNFQKLMMLVAISPDERHRLLTYFWSFRELIILYFFDHIDSGLTEFKVNITKFRLAPFKQLQDRLSREDSDNELDSIFT